MAETLVPERKTTLARALVHVFNHCGGDIKLSIAELHQKLRFGEIRAWANRVEIPGRIIPSSMYPVPIDPLTWTGMSVEWTENRASIDHASGAAKIEDIHVLADDIERLWPSSPQSTAAPKDQPQSAQREAIARAIAEVWGGEVPAGLTVGKRDQAIEDFAKKHGLAIPSDKTIQRYFKGQ